MIETGVAVSFVANVMACGCPSITGLGTLVKNNTVLCAAAQAARALTRSALVNILSGHAEWSFVGA